MESLIVKNINKSFDGKEALENISFEVKSGEFLSILGPSGCGKTTLLRIFIGLLPPDSGELILDGRDITKAPPDKRGMGIVFQNYALFENMTVLRNVEYALKLRKDLKLKSREISLKLLEQVGLSEHVNKYPYQLSGGQMQGGAIATRLSLRAELKRIQREMGTTMIYITHDQEEAFALSDRIMVMGNAKIHQLAAPKEILTAPADDYVKTFVIDNLKIKIDSLMEFASDTGRNGQES